MYIYLQKKAMYRIHYDSDPNNDKAMQSRQKPLDILHDCVVGQGAI